MSEETRVPPEGSTESDPTRSNAASGSTTDSSWQEVGKQFQALGESLAQAVRTAWENEETQRRVQEMRTGLESMAKQVGQAIDDTANSPQGQRVRKEAERTAESLRTATVQTAQEVRPQLINALEQLNRELQKLVDRMSQNAAQTPAGKTTDESTSTGPESGPGPQI